MKLVGALCLGLLLLCPAVNAETLKGRVTYVYDGDTLKIEGVGKVRLLGIDTPEREDSTRDDYYTRRYGIKRATLRRIAEEAHRYTLENSLNRRVELELDREAVDKYDRVLAYLYLPDGRMLNRQLLEEGLASVYRRFEFREKRNFLQSEKSARGKNRGLWQKTP